MSKRSMSRPDILSRPHSRFHKRMSMRLSRFVAVLIAVVLGSGAAFADCVSQTSPQFTAGGNVFGRIAAQWNAYFATKVDSNNGTACNLTLQGTINGSGATLIGLANQTFQSITINKNATALPSPLTGSLLQGGALDSSASRYEQDTFGAASYWTGRRADNTNVSPSALQNGDLISEFDAFGYDGTAYQGPVGAIGLFAAENFTTGRLGSKLSFSTTPIGSTTLTHR